MDLMATKATAAVAAQMFLRRASVRSPGRTLPSSLNPLFYQMRGTSQVHRITMSQSRTEATARMINISQKLPASSFCCCVPLHLPSLRKLLTPSMTQNWISPGTQNSSAFCIHTKDSLSIRQNTAIQRVASKDSSSGSAIDRL